MQSNSLHIVSKKEDEIEECCFVFDWDVVRDQKWREYRRQSRF